MGPWVRAARGGGRTVRRTAARRSGTQGRNRREPGPPQRDRRARHDARRSETRAFGSPSSDAGARATLACCSSACGWARSRRFMRSPAAASSSIPAARRPTSTASTCTSHAIWPRRIRGRAVTCACFSRPAAARQEGDPVWRSCGAPAPFRAFRALIEGALSRLRAADAGVPLRDAADTAPSALAACLGSSRPTIAIANPYRELRAAFARLIADSCGGRSTGTGKAVRASRGGAARRPEGRRNSSSWPRRHSPIARSGKRMPPSPRR